MSIWTNWDPLEEVIVGDCYKPTTFDNFIPTELQDQFNKILEETKEDLDNLAKLLESMNVKVHRPQVFTYPNLINLDSFSITMPMSPVVPRDQYLAYGETIFQTYTSMPDRYLDPRGYYDIFRQMFDKGYNWISMPPPNLMNINELPQWWTDGGKIYSLLSGQILWHTATMFKCGDSIIMNSLGPGSLAGLEWIKRNFVGTTIVENVNTYYNNWGHIDHGFFMINDDTVVCVDETFVPQCLQNKNLIQFGKFIKSGKNVVEYLTQLRSNPQEQPGLARLKNYITQWSGYDQAVFFDTNVLVVDPNNIIVSSIPNIMIKILKHYGVSVHICHQRHGLFWDSGIHCATLDLKRTGQKRKIIN